MILVMIKGINGDSAIPGFAKSAAGSYFSVDSFSFGAERELKDSGKAGTSDINVGVVELQEVSMSKSFDTASTWLARKAIAGSSCGTAEIKFVQTITDADSNQQNVVYLHMVLDNVFVKTWSVSGDEDDRPTEELSLWYNKIAFNYYTTKDGTTFENTGICSWDSVTQVPWEVGAAKLSTTLETHKAS
ncbi:MAG: type VI secretion system secreted protein Hcp [Mariniblastus sp.]|jgi:type VI secretion system secreted protein Hcp